MLGKTTGIWQFLLLFMQQPYWSQGEQSELYFMCDVVVLSLSLLLSSQAVQFALFFFSKFEMEFLECDRYNEDGGEERPEYWVNR